MRGRKSFGRTVVAAWFTGLFLFIYAEKLLHSHIAADHINKQQAHVSTPAACALCEFQPGKDAVVSQPFILAGPIAAFPDLIIDRCTAIIERFRDSHAGRGPPAMAADPII